MNTSDYTPIETVKALRAALKEAEACAVTYRLNGDDEYTARVPKSAILASLKGVPQNNAVDNCFVSKGVVYVG